MNAPSVRIDFIVGMARSGTTWLGRTLASHPDVAVFGETSFFGRLYVPPRDGGTYGEAELQRVAAIQREQDWCATTGDENEPLVEDYAAVVDAALGALRPPITPADAFRTLVSAVARAEGKPRVIEKTPHHVHWLERIAPNFPESRFVLLTRDPYEFMLSLRHLGARVDGRVRRAADRPWHHPLLCALAWRGYALSVERALQRYGGRIFVVEARVLRDSLASVQSFLELDVDDLTPAAGENSSFRTRQRPPQRAQDVFWMNLVAGSVMRRTGYEPRRIPRRPLPILASIVELPFALAYVAVGLRRRVPGSLRAYLARWLGR